MSIIEKPADIIHHIIGEELDTANLSVDSARKQIAINAHSGWKMAFTVHKKINSKKLIEGIAKESKLFPFFKGNKLSFNSIKDTYDETDVDPANGRGFTIKDSDVILYNFNRTKIEDIKTKVILNYHHDYATDDFKKSTKSLDIAQTAFEFFEGAETPDYENSYYGIPEDATDGSGGQGGDPIEVKYIRHQGTSSPYEETIVKLQQFLLAWYCNQHNTCKIRLPLSYLYAEVGDIVAFPKLLNGRKAYGEDYSLEGSPAGVTSLIRNGQQILPYWMVMEVSKTLEYVELNLIQLHTLVPVIPNDAPTAVLTCFPEYIIEGGGFSILDASESSDPEGSDLEYVWTASPEEGFGLHVVPGSPDWSFAKIEAPAGSAGTVWNISMFVRDPFGAVSETVSCMVTSVAEPPVLGCTDPEANNYNPDATIEDNTCSYNVSWDFDNLPPIPHGVQPEYGAPVSVYNISPGNSEGEGFISGSVFPINFHYLGISVNSGWNFDIDLMKWDSAESTWVKVDDLFTGEIQPLIHPHWGISWTTNSWYPPGFYKIKVTVLNPIPVYFPGEPGNVWYYEYETVTHGVSLYNFVFNNQ